MKKTKNYAMPYPEQDDYFNVEDFQDMMVSVDDLMKKLSDSGTQISSDAEHLYNQTKAQMDNIQKRMNTFTSLKDGSTTGDAELEDIRVAYDGKEYGNAGEAVREQASDIHKALFGAGASIWSKAKSESTKYVAETKGMCISNERFTAAGVVAKISRGTFAQNESTLNLDRECSAYIVEFEKNPGTVYMPSAETIKIVSTTKIIFEANGNARCWIPVKKGQYLAVDSTATAYTSESNHVPYMLYDQANKTLECRGFGSTGSIEPVDPYSLALEYKLEYDMDDTGLVKQIDANREDAASLKEDIGDLVEVIHSKNLLDASKLHNGFLQNSGVVSTADWALDYWYTDKIPCTKSDIVFANGTSNPQNQLGGLYKNGKWVASLSSNATISKTQDESEKEYYFKIVFSEACPDFDAIILNTLHLNNFEKKFVMLNCIEPDVYSQYDIYHTSKMISKNVETQAITESLMDEIEQKINAKVPNVINCWGDSLTFGYGATDRNTETYPKVLQKLLGDSFTVNNYAVSGEGTQQIASRQGGTLAYVQPCTIPANGSVNITLKDLVGTSIFLLNQGDAGINPCYINGIKGTLSKDSSNIVFTRLENGDAVEIMHPVPLITDANKNARDGITIIWCGSNNRTYFNNSPTTEKNEVHNIIRCIKTMIKHSNYSGKYIVIGLTSKAYMPQIEMVNKVFATEFGEHFLDVRNNILLSGLKESGITPVDQDNTDIENGEIPSSLRVDEIHFNTKGYALIAKYVYELGKALGYWD